MFLKVLPVGDIEANCYIIGCEETGEGVVVDPGAEGEKIAAALTQEGLQLKYILLTHGHADHIGAVDELRDKTGAQVAIHSDDAPMLTNPRLNLSTYIGPQVKLKPADLLLTDGDVLNFGRHQLQVLHTPGHTKGGITLLVGDWVFSGDTLFAGSVGRSDFPGGSHETLINSIKKKLFPLPDEYLVYPGHGLKTTIGEEKKYNPFLR